MEHYVSRIAILRLIQRFVQNITIKILQLIWFLVKILRFWTVDPAPSNSDILLTISVYRLYIKYEEEWW